jgi:microcystin-dependent protein
MADKRRNLGIPSGVVFPFAGTTAPYGYLVCDGSTVSRASYPALFISLGSGTLHGAGDGSTTFHLPDYRGKFMRGVDGVAGNDPDKTTRTHPVSGAVVGNVVGSQQADNFGQHTHIQNAHDHQILGIPNQGVNAGNADNVKVGATVLRNTTGTVATNQNSGGNETRPKNVNVNYIVKV